MLSWIITRLHSCSAMILVVLYAICAVLPSVALAFPHGSTSSHCLTGDHRGVTNARFQDGIDTPGGIHTLGDSAIHEHTGNSKEGGDGKLKCHARACCGLFYFAAVTSDSAVTYVQPVHASLAFRVFDESLDGRAHKRIGRPPKSFLSL
ncbi:MAG: hypothetical protein ACR2KT_11945 [Methylocella sp.]